MKYLLIDGNNLACRCAFANADLKNSDGIPTGVHYGFMNSLITIKQKFPDYVYLIAWDGRSKRRMQESQAAVLGQIIPDAYKENRKKDEAPQPLKDFHEQAAYLQRGIGQLGIAQIRMMEYEADDILAAYAKKLKVDSEVVVVTSDRDYYQILDTNVRIYDGMKFNNITLESWVKENGITPQQYVDIGALMGDDGDNIYGVPGIGEKTALKEIKKYGTWQKTLEAYKAKYQGDRIKYVDLNTPNLKLQGDVEPDGLSMFNYLKDKRSEKGKVVYPEISFNMPYTGVLYAFDKEFIKATKSELMALLFEERIRLAYSLKKMDDDIPNLPDIPVEPFNEQRIGEYFDYYDITTLNESIKFFQ